MYYSYSRHKYHSEEWGIFEWMNNMLVGYKAKCQEKGKWMTNFHSIILIEKICFAGLTNQFSWKVVTNGIFLYTYISISTYVFAAYYSQIQTGCFKDKEKQAHNQLGSGYTDLKKFNNSFWTEFPKKLTL